MLPGRKPFKLAFTLRTELLSALRVGAQGTRSGPSPATADTEVGRGDPPCELRRSRTGERATLEHLQRELHVRLTEDHLR